MSNSQPLFDHYTITVKNLSRSADFYHNVLRLPEIENRTRKEHIRWFSLGNGMELHLVKGNTSGITTNVGVHFALAVSNFDDFLSHLKRQNVITNNSKAVPDEISIRADGVKQVYFQDPDGYWIEVNNEQEQ